MSIRQGSTIIAGSTPVKSVPIIGEIKKVCGTANYIPEGCLQCNGTEFRGDQFSDLWTNYLTSSPAKLNVCTYAEYSNQLNTYGFCNSFAVDTVNQTFKVPTRNSYRKLVKKYINGNDWYNLYDDGWVEQGGNFTTSASWIETTITFKIPMSNTAYSTSFVESATACGGDSPTIQSKSTSNMVVWMYNATGASNWKVCGYSSIPDTTANIDREFVCVANGFVNASTFDWSTWQNGLNAKLDKNLGNSTNITNCIINIPQDINLELSNGTLTLKAGSKVYVPNGSGVFDTVTISSDLTLSSYGSGSTDFMVFYNTNTGVLQPMAVSVCYSGDTEPYTPTTSTDGVWYDTTNNYVKFENTTATTWTSGLSFPLCVCSRSSGTPSFINNVFNGLGYIGSTAFVLPGVKGLIPNGRNSDGTLKNIETTVSSVNVYTFTTSVTVKFGTGRLLLSSSGSLGALVGDYDEVNNYVIRSNGNRITNLVCASIGIDSGVITDFKPNTCFHALDWSSSNKISSWSMPSSKYIDLTLGSSGDTYTAPANGYFYLSKSTAATNQYITMYQYTDGTAWFGSNITQPINGAQVRCILPVKKGQVVGINYTTTGTTNRFCFVYAEGEV